MTIVIGSIFLPYTVHFEVAGEAQAKSINYEIAVPANGKGRNNSIPSTPSITLPQSAVLPSLSIANSQQLTPLSSSPKSASLNEKNNNDSADSFFSTYKTKRSDSNQLTDNLNDKLGPQYIQPRPRKSFGVSSSIIETKKADQDIVQPSLKINRSSSNLSSLNSSYTNVTHPISNQPRARSFKQSHGFTLHSNSSANSLVINEEDESLDENLFDSRSSLRSSMADDNQDFNDLLHGRIQSELAPYGGFSNPDIENVYKKGNIFQTAPWKVVPSTTGNGSLFKAVKLAADTHIIKKRKWVGTLAMPSDAVPDNVIDKIADYMSEEYNSEAVLPNDITFQGHYMSFCKQILWPTLHYQIPDDVKSKAFEDRSWGHYKLLNQLIADKIVDVYNRENKDCDPNDPENMIWIHDYHLLLVPKMVREKLPNAKIGLFLHVSFPSSEVFRCLAQRIEILQGMLGADCISFQNNEYVRHFLQTCNRLLLADINEYGIAFHGRFTMLNTIQVGIDTNALSKTLKSEEVSEWRSLIRTRWGKHRLLVSRDKLDKLRGVKKKLLAYEKFLQDHPEYYEDTVLIQICLKSSLDHDYEDELTQIVSRINSHSKNISDNQPVAMIHTEIDFDQYLALLCEADAFIVSSMREGLNLTCHEFIAATSVKHSPLIISEFTGSASLLEHDGKGALLINPWDISDFSKKIYDLLTMSQGEKLSRWANCFRTVIENDSNNWVKSCIASVQDAWMRHQARKSTTFTEEVFKNFYHNGKNGKRLFFLAMDSDGTVSSMRDPKSSSSAVREADKNFVFSQPNKYNALLGELLSDSQNQVYLISNLKRSDLNNMYSRTSNLGLIAENGGYIKLIGSKRWISIVDEDELKSWMPQVKALLDSKVERLPGSYCELGDCTIRFHAGKSFVQDHERALDTMGECIQHINILFHNKSDIHATLVKNSVIVQQEQLLPNALKLIYSYYSNSEGTLDSNDFLERYQAKEIPLSEPNTPLKETSSFLDNSENNTVSSLFICGGCTPFDDSNYTYFNSLKDEKIVDQVLTVAIVDTGEDINTSATHIVSGKNELLLMLSNIGPKN